LTVLCTHASVRAASVRVCVPGAVAQLGERLNGIQEVVGSIPIGSTRTNDIRAAARRLVSFPPVSCRLPAVKFPPPRRQVPGVDSRPSDGNRRCRRVPLRAVKVTLFIGDVVDAPAEAVCTSTNPRLTLMEGTGGSVREKGGWEILRACRAILADEARRSGRHQVAAGSAHATTAGSLTHRLAIHCVASDARHRSSAEVIGSCVRNALLRAAEEGCSTVAMPVFAAGHAHFPFEAALAAMAKELRRAVTTVESVTVVVLNRSREARAREILGDLLTR
jgi:O-acetyl-ADP-ribose deacetylase (regulator of RNase III)